MAVANLRELRFNRGLSPEQLGKHCKLSGKTIRRLEEGHSPTAKTAKKVAAYFGLEPSDIWPLEGTEAPA